MLERRPCECERCLGRCDSLFQAPMQADGFCFWLTNAAVRARDSVRELPFHGSGVRPADLAKPRTAARPCRSPMFYDDALAHACGAQPEEGGSPVPYSHALQPLSKMMRHLPGASSRQMEIKVPVSRPPESKTGPVLKASVPESRTSTVSGCQEKGAVGSS